MSKEECRASSSSQSRGDNQSQTTSEHLRDGGDLSGKGTQQKQLRDFLRDDHRDGLEAKNSSSSIGIHSSDDAPLPSLPDQVTIFWASDLNQRAHALQRRRQRTKKKERAVHEVDSDQLNDETLLLLGCVFEGGPGELCVVAADVCNVEDCPGSTLDGSQRPKGGKGTNDKGLTVIGTFEAANTVEKPLCPQTRSKNGKGKGPESSDCDGVPPEHCPRQSQCWLEVASSMSSRCSRWNWSSSSDQPWPVLRRLSMGRVEAVTGSSLAQKTTSVALTVVLFDTPDPSMLRYYTLDPQHPDCRFDGTRNTKHRQATLQGDLGPKLDMLLAGNPERWFEITGGFRPGTEPGSGLRKAVRCINDVQRMRRSVLDRAGQAKQACTSSGSGEHTSRRSPTPSSIYSATPQSLPLLSRRSTKQLKRLLVLSSTIRQVSLRIQQISSFPASARQLRRVRQRNLLPLRTLSVRYIATWNGLWLIANDLILGWFIATIVDQHRDEISSHLVSWLRLSITGLEQACQWLDDWPGGLKLNTELSRFYRDMYVGLISLFQTMSIGPLVGMLSTSTDECRSFWTVFALGGRCCGLSIQVCLLVDVVKLATLQVRWLHVLARSQYAVLLHLISVFLDLFRGKKRNVLSSAAGAHKAALVDTTYGLDQLLLGTILFTLALFLLPTVAVYHMLFSAAQLFTEVVGLLLERMLVDVVLNATPLLALLLRIKDPQRVPDGIVLIKAPNHQAMARPQRGLEHSRLILQSRPVAFPYVLRACLQDLAGVAGQVPQMLIRAVRGQIMVRSSN